MTRLSFPFTEEKLHALKVGGEVLISGVVFAKRSPPRCRKFTLPRFA